MSQTAAKDDMMTTFEIPFKMNTAGYIIAVDVSHDVFMQEYAGVVMDMRYKLMTLYLPVPIHLITFH
jgi:glucose dehydrogenase